MADKSGPPPDVDGYTFIKNALIYVSAITRLVLRVASLQKESGFLVTFLVQIMQQSGVAIAWELLRQSINVRKQGRQVRFGSGRLHSLYGLIQPHKRLQQILF